MKLWVASLFFFLLTINSYADNTSCNVFFKSVELIPVDQPESVTKKEVIATRSKTEKFDSSPLYEQLPPETLLGSLPKEFVELFDFEAFLLQKNGDRYNVTRIVVGTPKDEKLKNKLKITTKNFVAAHTVRIGKPGHQVLEINIQITGRELRSLMRSVDYIHLERNQMTLDELRSHGAEYLEHANQTSNDFNEYLGHSIFKTRPYTLTASEPESSKIVLYSRNDLPTGTLLSNNSVTGSFDPENNKQYDVVLQSTPDFVPILKNGVFDHFTENNYDTNRYLLMKFFFETVLPLLK